TQKFILAGDRLERENDLRFIIENNQAERVVLVQVSDDRFAGFLGIVERFALHRTATVQHCTKSQWGFALGKPFFGGELEHGMDRLGLVAENGSVVKLA